MNLETFLHHLHYDTEKVVPPDWEVDWGDAPLPYKLYRGLPDIQLSGDVPLKLTPREPQSQPGLEELGNFLWYVFGITRYVQMAFMEGTEEKEAVSYAQLFRRFVPSGGALYPNELYVYVKLEVVPEGIYHYDAAHHRLLMLREGNYDSYVSRSMGNSCDISDCFCTVFVSTVFWKNFYKYNNFSYRLQGLDAGVVIGQALEVADRMGFSSRVCYQFLDQSINHLLGLPDQEESVYAVIPLSIQPSIPSVGNVNREEVSSVALSREVSVLNVETYNRSKRVRDYPLIKEMNHVSILETTQSFAGIKREERVKKFIGTEFIMLPYTEPFSYDFAAACRERHSPDLDFMMGSVSIKTISTLLRETFSFSYQNDLDGMQENPETRLSLNGFFYNVEGIPNGAYAYDKEAHALRRVTSGDFREVLQGGLTMHNVNLFQVPLCLHIVGGKDHLKRELGYRGYRIQQMEAGILLQRMLLISGALGMGGHPLLGFDVKQCDELYRAEAEQITSLIQVPVGPYRPRACLNGSLIS
ncbi:SagB family peptide dehydrogenase [Neobacillus sp. Marseille-QA0830]